MFLKLLSVFALSIFEGYAAIILGHGYKLNNWVIVISTISGGIVGVFIAAFLGKKIEKFINEKFRKGKTPKEKKGFLYTLWNKYGLFGVGLIGTFFLGAPASIGVGVGFNADLKKLVPLCLVSVILRCIVFTFLGDKIKGLF
jgi:membrane protein YqaA with SNARE-associated domain